MTDHALLEGGVVLGAAENVGHELPENGTATHELNHARGYGGAKKAAAVKPPYDPRCKLELAGESGSYPIGVHLGIALGDGSAQQFAGAHGVEQPFSGQRIDESGRVTYHGPVLADHRALRKRRHLRRGQDVAVKAGARHVEFLLADENLQMLAQLGLVMRSHAAANADRQMIATREGPDIAVKVRKELDDDGVFGLRNEIALRDFKFVLLERTRFGQKLVARAGGEYQKVGGVPFAFDAIARFFSRRVDGDDVGAAHFAAGFAGAVQQQTV